MYEMYVFLFRSFGECVYIYIYIYLKMYIKNKFVKCGS